MWQFNSIFFQKEKDASKNKGRNNQKQQQAVDNKLHGHPTTNEDEEEGS